MVETLEFLIRQAADHPRHGRAALFKELLRSETFLLTVDEPLKEETVTRVTKADETMPVWADKDPELGGLWVPVFPSRDAVAAFVTRRKLKAPKGQEFLWMGHQPGAVFALLRGVPCFAGVRLHDQNAVVDVPWSQVRELSQNRVPSDGPELYDMPVARLTLPRGARLAFGTVDAGPEQPRGKLLCLPDAGHFKLDDTRKLVRLPLEDGPAWMACRHFLQVLKYLQAENKGSRHVEDMLCSLMSFQMFGEAEALCAWIIDHAGEMFGWLALAAIYARTGRLAECAELCERACKRYPDEPAFALNGGRALRSIGRAEDARRMLADALERHPGDARLRSALDA